MLFKDLRNQRQQIRTHHLGAGGPCIDMAVSAALVAAVPEIDLQGCELSALQWRENALKDSHRLRADRGILPDPGSTVGREHSTGAELMLEFEAGDRIRTDGL